MDIIFQKSQATSNQVFYNEALTNNLISGVYLNVTATKDNVLIVINEEDANNFFAPDYTLQQLNEFDILTLEEALTRLGNTNKKIVLNLLPLYLYDLPSTDLEKIVQNAINYINILKSVIDRFKRLNIYLCSRVQRSVTLLKNIIKDRPIGLLVTPDNLTYIDVNFYIIDITMVNPLILIQQIDLRKELMIDVSTEQDIALAKATFVKEKMTPADRLIYDQLQFITNYPNFLYQELN